MPKLAICTPLRGPVEAASVSLRYALALSYLLRDPNAELLPHVEFISTDLVRARSRAVRDALLGGYDHLLFWDEDVSGRPEQIATAIKHMVASGEDLIGAMYLRKDGSHIPAIGGGSELLLLPMGFTLISRNAMQIMSEHYASELTFDDNGKPTVALFNLVIRNGRLLSEDFSFCQRWLDIGGSCRIYYGTVLDHAGQHLYRPTEREEHREG